MQQPFFRSLRSLHGHIGDGTVGDLITWIENYVNIAVPGHGIEYWHPSDNPRGPETYLYQDPAPLGVRARSIVGAICGVTPGRSEGLLIYVTLRHRDGRMVELCWAKSFGTANQCWAVARAVTEALDAIVLDGALPQLVDMAERLPLGWRRHGASCPGVLLSLTDNELHLETVGGILIDWRGFPGDRDNARAYIEAYVADWKKVLDACGIRCDERARSLPHA